MVSSAERRQVADDAVGVPAGDDQLPSRPAGRSASPLGCTEQRDGLADALASLGGAGPSMLRHAQWGQVAECIG